MKIVFSNYDDINNPYYGGGGSIAIHEVAKRLASQHSVTVLNCTYPSASSSKVDGVEYKRIAFSTGIAQLDQLLFQLSLPYHVLTNNFDVWFESFTPPFSTAFLQLFTNRPVVGLVHLLGAKDMQKKYHLPFNVVENLGLKKYKYFIVLNEHVKAKINKVNKEAKIVIIPNGVDSKLFKGRTSKNKKYLLFIGRIDIHQKGLDMLLSSYKHIEDKINHEVLIAGSGEKKQIEELKKRIVQAGLKKKVKFVGKVTGETKLKIFSNAALMLMPSRYETQPLTLLEAFASHLPVVTFDIEDLTWLNPRYSAKVKAFDVKEYAETILDLLSNPKKQDSIAKRAKKYSREFDWSLIAGKYQNFIQSL